MAMYTDFLLATDDALRRAFVGWGDPQGPAPQEDAPRPDTSSLVRVEMKSVDPVVLAHLLVAAHGETLSRAIAECSRPALIPPSTLEGSLVLVRLPERLVETLATLEPERAALAAKWEALLLADFASIPNEHSRNWEIERWTGQAIRILEALGELVRGRGEGEALYLLVTV